VLIIPNIAAAAVIIPKIISNQSGIIQQSP
jgi:hypothetical protein